MPNSNLPHTVTGPVHTVTHTWEPNRDVLDIRENKVGTDVISKYDYFVNGIGQRKEVATSGTAFPAVPSWLWDYDSMGQVIAADSSVSTSDRAYQYDAIGNRKKSADSLTLPGSDNYTSNALNQYTTGTTATPVPGYDFDGNAIAYPLPAAPTTNSALVWDAENRMISTTVGTTTTGYFYDAQSRRIAVTTGGTSTLFVYDAWNCIAEYSRSVGVSPTLQITRLWGTDLSGSLQGAGGVGGLLVESQISNSQISNFYPTYDGNGNVSEYLASNGTVTAHFEYDPFGRTVVNTDTGSLFTYRFSTKPLDSATGLYYYGYRYYDPVSGRWPSRDPIEERGGVNLYGFVGNDPIWNIDVLGLKTRKPCPFDVTAGHSGDPTVPGNVDSREREFDRNADNCNSGRFYGASCGRTGVGSNLAWPTEAARQQSEDGTLPPHWNPKTRKHDIPNPNNGDAQSDDLTIGQLIRTLIQQAENDAEGECLDMEKCCSSIQLKVTCLHDAQMANARKNDPLATRGCNYANTFKCPGKNGNGARWAKPRFE